MALRAIKILCAQRYIFMARRAIPIIAFHDLRGLIIIIIIYILVSLARLCVVEWAVNYQTGANFRHYYLKTKGVTNL